MSYCTDGGLYFVAITGVLETAVKECQKQVQIKKGFKREVPWRGIEPVTRLSTQAKDIWASQKPMSKMATVKSADAPPRPGEHFYPLRAGAQKLRTILPPSFVRELD